MQQLPACSSFSGFRSKARTTPIPSESEASPSADAEQHEAIFENSQPASILTSLPGDANCRVIMQWMDEKRM